MASSLHNHCLQARHPVKGGERCTPAGNLRKQPKAFLHDSVDIYRLFEEIKTGDVDIVPPAITSVGE